jgi:uncharacterized membrane protein required for colicin V production
MENLPVPNIADYLALAVIVLGSLLGMKRGLSGELARLVSVIVALLFGIEFLSPFGEWVEENSRLGTRSAYAFAFLVTVVGALILLFALRFLLKRVLKIVVAESFDRTGGLIAGLISSTAIVVMIFLGLNLWPHEYLNTVFGSESIVGRNVLRIVPRARQELQESGLPIPDKGRREENG